MGASAPLVFEGITLEQYASLLKKAEANGLALSGNNGKASKLGVEVEWNYVPDMLKLTFQCLRTPFFVDAETVNEKIKSLVKEALA